MNADLGTLTGLLAAFWFLLYWILGGVFFGLVALWRLGRVRKVRFSCLFSLWALACAVGAAWQGIRFSEKAVTDCLVLAQNKAEIITSIFGCGFVGIFGGFALGLAALVLGGLFVMAISTSHNPPWIDLKLDEDKSEPPHQDIGFFS
jgi:hypothetical protein